MAPIERDFEGYWGKPTSTIDWCEANYEVNYYIAEFWNTISNVVMIVPPIIGAYYAYIDNLEIRFIFSHLALMVVGIGSWCFHGTLLYNMQLMDELPMIWGSSFLLYSLIEVNGKPKSHNRSLQIGLFFYCLIVTIIYLTVKNPIFHQGAYGLMVSAMFVGSFRIARYYEHSSMALASGLGIYSLGFMIWNMDNVFCQQIRVLRSEVPSSLSPVLQFHAWWHVFAGLGTYMGLVFSTHARLKYLKKPTWTQTFPFIIRGKRPAQ